MNDRHSSVDIAEIRHILRQMDTRMQNIGEGFVSNYDFRVVLSRFLEGTPWSTGYSLGYIFFPDLVTTQATFI